MPETREYLLQEIEKREEELEILRKKLRLLDLDKTKSELMRIFEDESYLDDDHGGLAPDNRIVCDAQDIIIDTDVGPDDYRPDSRKEIKFLHKDCDHVTLELILKRMHDDINVILDVDYKGTKFRDSWTEMDNEHKEFLENNSDMDVDLREFCRWLGRIDLFSFVCNNVDL